MHTSISSAIFSKSCWDWHAIKMLAHLNWECLNVTLTAWAAGCPCLGPCLGGLYFIWLLQMQAASTVVKSDSGSGVGPAPRDDPVTESHSEPAPHEPRPAGDEEVLPANRPRPKAPLRAETVPGSSNHRRRVKSCRLLCCNARI